MVSSEEIEERFGLIFSEINFVNSFCSCPCQHCEEIPGAQHVFPCNCKVCDACFLRSKDTWISAQCPNHERRFHINLVKTIQMNIEEFMKAEAYCRNKEDGCPHIATITALKKHQQEECCYKRTECPLQCGGKIALKDLAEHLRSGCPKRILECSYCETRLMLGAEQSHYKICEMFPIKCQHCNSDVKRCELEAHEESCENRMVSCRFASIGCSYLEAKVNVTQHETARHNDRDVFLASMKELDDMKKKAADQQEQLLGEIKILTELIRKVKVQNPSQVNVLYSLEEMNEIKRWSESMIASMTNEAPAGDTNSGSSDNPPNAPPPQDAPSGVGVPPETSPEETNEEPSDTTEVQGSTTEGPSDETGTQGEETVDQSGATGQHLKDTKKLENAEGLLDRRRDLSNQ